MFCWRPSYLRDMLSQYYGYYLLFDSWKCFAIQGSHLELGKRDNVVIDNAIKMGREDDEFKMLN